MTTPVTTARPASPFAPSQPRLTRTTREVPNHPKDINTYDLFVRIGDGPVGDAVARATQAAKAGDHAGAQAVLRQGLLAGGRHVADALTIAQAAADLGAARHFWQKDLKAAYGTVAAWALDLAIANARTGADFEAITNVAIKAVDAGGAKSLIQDREPAIKARQQALVAALRTIPELAGAMADQDLPHQMRGIAVAEAAKRVASAADAATLIDALAPYQTAWRRDLAKAGLAKAHTMADAAALLATMGDRDDGETAKAIGLKAVDLVKDLGDARRCFEAVDRAGFYGRGAVWAALEAKLQAMPDAFELRQVVKMKMTR